jgi:hypothetical protein
MQDKQGHLSPEQVSEQKKTYGALLKALVQGKGMQPPIKHGYSHPDRFHPATKHMPARAPIPRSEWDIRLWLNHIADRYASHDFSPSMLAEARRPLRVFRIQVEDLLTEVMPPDSLYWTSGDMPSVSVLSSAKAPLREARSYLRQKDAK